MIFTNSIPQLKNFIWFLFLKAIFYEIKWNVIYCLFVHYFKEWIHTDELYWVLSYFVYLTNCQGSYNYHCSIFCITYINKPTRKFNRRTSKYGFIRMFILVVVENWIHVVDGKIFDLFLYSLYIPSRPSIQKQIDDVLMTMQSRWWLIRRSSCHQ